MYAYVRYLNDQKKDIVPIEAIQNFNINKFKENHKEIDLHKKYKITWNGSLHDGTIIYVADIEAELVERIEERRPRVPPISLAKSTDGESTSGEFCTQSKSSLNAVATSSTRAILERKRKHLVEKQNNPKRKVSNNELQKTNENLSKQNDNVLENYENLSEDNVNITTPISSKSIGSTPKSSQRRSGLKISINSTAPISNNKSIVSTPKSSQQRSNLIEKLQTNKQTTEKECSNPECKKRIKTMEDKNNLLKTEILNLKARNQENQQLIKELSNLNISLQRDILNEFNELKERILKTGDNVNVETNDLPTGFIRRNSNTIHLGKDVWLPLPIFDSIKIQSKTPSAFVKNTAVAIFGIETLKKSSVTGNASNRNKGVARPKLDSNKILAIKAILRHWLSSEKKYDEPSIDYESSLVTTHLSKKIAEYNRPQKCVEVVGQSKSGTDDEDVADVEENDVEESGDGDEECYNRGEQSDNDGEESYNHGEESGNHDEESGNRSEESECDVGGSGEYEGLA